MMKKPQEFYVTLRVVTDPEACNKPITESKMMRIMKTALNPDKMDDAVATIRFGDVIDVTK